LDTQSTVFSTEPQVPRTVSKLDYGDHVALSRSEELAPCNAAFIPSTSSAHVVEAQVDRSLDRAGCCTSSWRHSCNYLRSGLLRFRAELYTWHP
jgi:hypothetical protein